MDIETQESIHCEDEAALCDVCDKLIKANSKCRQFKSPSHGEFI